MTGNPSGAGDLAVSTPQAAVSEIARIRGEALSDPRHPYNDARHPDYQAAQKRMARLYEIAYPGMQPDSL